MDNFIELFICNMRYTMSVFLILHGLLFRLLPMLIQKKAGHSLLYLIKCEWQTTQCLPAQKIVLNI